MTAALKPKPTAMQRYGEIMAEVEDLAMDIEILVAEAGGTDAEVHWGHVGTASDVERLLTEARRALRHLAPSARIGHRPEDDEARS